MKQNKSCETCYYSRPVDMQNPNYYVIECRRHTPVLKDGEIITPCVPIDYWCGEWDAKSEVNI